MNMFARFLFTAVVAIFSLGVFAGFSDGLDLSALNEMLEIDESIDKISINVNGQRDGNLWQPADIAAEKDSGGNLTGNVIYYGGGMTEGINSAKSYVEFGKYDDEASLNAFFMRDDFLNSRGDIMYLMENLRDCYTKAEDKNAELIESVIDQVTANVENYLANEGSGGTSTTAAKMIAAYNRFFDSFENNSKKESDRKKNLIKKLESLKKSSANKNMQLILEEMMKTMMNNYNNHVRLADTVASNYIKFKQLRMSYLNSMNTIGAYLGSTNAMEFLSSGLKFEDLDEDDLKRWYKFSNPGSFGEDKDRVIGPLGTGSSRTFDTIYGNLAPSRFMMWYDDETLASFMSMYGEGEFNENKIIGFKREIESDSIIVTNWVANKITAPKNWADGSSIIVTNGKFKVASASSDKYALKIIGTTASNYKLIGAPASKTNTVTFASASDSNVAVTVGGNNDDITVTIGVYYK